MNTKKIILIVGICIVALILAVLLIKNLTSTNKKNSIVEVVNTGQTKPVILADGSKFWLRKGSKIVYPETFTDSIREIKLEGEAFFDIARIPDNSFIVNAGKTKIKTINTSFLVQKLNNSDTVTVYVTSGRVEFFEANNAENKIEIRKEEKAIFMSPKKQITKTEISDFNFQSWRTGKFFFNNISLKQACKMLSEYYQVNILPQKEYETQLITVNIENLSIELAIKTICEKNNRTFKKVNDSIVIN